MKRFLSIVLIVAAIFMLLAFPVIPHHHHGNFVCVVVENCEYGDSENQQNSGEENSSHDEHSCNLVKNFDINNHSHLRDFLVLQSCNILAVLFDCYDFKFQNLESKKVEYGEYFCFYRLTEINSPSALRAPPAA